MIEIPRFNAKTDMYDAHEFFKEHGCVILKDSFDLSFIQDMKEEIQFVIKQQVTKHLPKEQNFMPGNKFDRGLIELAQHNDLLRQRLYEVIQGLPSLYKFLTNSIFKELVNEWGMERPTILSPQFLNRTSHHNTLSVFLTNPTIF